MLGDNGLAVDAAAIFGLNYNEVAGVSGRKLHPDRNGLF